MDKYVIFEYGDVSGIHRVGAWLHDDNIREIRENMEEGREAEEVELTAKPKGIILNIETLEKIRSEMVLQVGEEHCRKDGYVYDRLYNDLARAADNLIMALKLTNDN